MPIMQNGNIEMWLQQRIEMMTAHIMQAINNVGLEAVNVSRDTHRYIDRTGNLTSSIGYIIVQDGQVIEQGDFAQFAGDEGDGADGSAKGKEYATELAQECGNGTYLILLAGMPYAQYVEAKGLNVLDGASLYAKDELPQKIKEVLSMYA